MAKMDTGDFSGAGGHVTEKPLNPTVLQYDFDLKICRDRDCTQVSFLEG